MDLKAIAATLAASQQKQDAGEVLGYATGKVLKITESENGSGNNLRVKFPDPVGEVTVYVKADRVLPAIGDEAEFVAVKDKGALTPHIRLAGRLNPAAVSEVFTM